MASTPPKVPIFPLQYGEQTAGATRMQEQHVVRRPESAFPRQFQRPANAFPVDTGSRNRPSFAAISAIASFPSSDGMA